MRTTPGCLGWTSADSKIPEARLKDKTYGRARRGRILGQKRLGCRSHPRVSQSAGAVRGAPEAQSSPPGGEKTPSDPRGAPRSFALQRQRSSWERTRERLGARRPPGRATERCPAETGRHALLQHNGAVRNSEGPRSTEAEEGGGASRFLHCLGKVMQLSSPFLFSSSPVFRRCRPPGAVLGAGGPSETDPG